MNILDVQLSTFKGPLDLLLQLIEQEEIDIYNIPIHRITQQYLQKMELDQLDPQTGAEYLLLASELLEIKSRMLLPDHQLEPIYPDGEDPRAELLARLLSYRKVKAAKEILDTLHEAHRIFSEDFLLEISEERFTVHTMFDPLILKEAYIRALAAGERFSSDAPETFERFTKSNYSVSLKQKDILQLLSYMSSFPFSSLLNTTAPKGEWVASFLALLKLQQDQHIHLFQGAQFSDIMIEKRQR